MKVRAYNDQPDVRTTIDYYHTNISFTDAWTLPAIGKLNLHHLLDFCGGLACVFPNQGTTESDFSVLCLEKDKFRSVMSDFSLEGVLQCKGREDICMAYNRIVNAQ